MFLSLSDSALGIVELFSNVGSGKCFVLMEMCVGDLSLSVFVQTVSFSGQFDIFFISFLFSIKQTQSS